MGFNECFEPYTSNIYSRRVLAGEFQVVNPWLLKDLVDMGLWSDNMKNRIIADGGSIQRIPNIPDETKALYKTVWEISQRHIVQMAADRGAFIDQSQSLNIHMKEPTMGKITSMHFTGWKLGLKTGMYYLRTMAASAPIQFTVDQEKLKVVDVNVARASNRKRVMQGGSPSLNPVAAPSPMYKGAPNGVAPQDPPTPAVTPPPESQAKRLETEKKAPVESPMKPRPFKADQEEGSSPKVLALDGTTVAPDEELPQPALKPKLQAEDAAEDSTDREGDIYADAVLACSIENPESCLMCSG